MSIKVCNIRLDKEHLQPDQNSMNAFLETVNVKLTTSSFVTTATTDYWSVLIFYEPKKESKKPILENDLIGVDYEIFEALKTWRNNKASELNLKHFMVSHNSELRNIAIKKPKTISELKKIKGFGEIKTAKFGKDILKVTNA
jgi:superfamily II DNA helicase RecQ